HLVIADFPIRTADFQQVNKIEVILYEIFLGKVPGNGSTGKETPPAAFGKIGGTIVAKIEIDKVFFIEIITHTAKNVLSRTFRCGTVSPHTYQTSGKKLVQGGRQKVFPVCTEVVALSYGLFPGNKGVDVMVAKLPFIF